MYKNKLRIIFISIIFIIILSIVFTFHFSHKIKNTVLVYSEEEANKVLSTIVNKIVLNAVTTYVDFDKLYEVSKDKNGNIQTIDFNSLAVNDILSFITSSVDENLNKFDNGSLEFDEYLSNSFFYPIQMRNNGIISLVPLGISLDNIFFANFGPKIPIKLQYIGSVSTNLNTSLKDYGINNALLILSVHIEVTERVYLPFCSKRIIVKNDIPISIKIIQGVVPTYYGGILNKSSPILSSNME